MALRTSGKAVAQEPSLATIRALVRAYQAFARYSETFVRQYDLTPAQFDVIATLGNTQGLTMGSPWPRSLRSALVCGQSLRVAQ